MKLLVVLLALVGCESKSSPPAPAPAPTAPPVEVVDLAGPNALAPVRDAFNAHKGELRFLTLLSPT